MNSKARILIVEDNGIIAISTKMVLLEMGHKVLPIAMSGDTTRKILRDKRPDTVLMDINIFGPQDGIELADEIYRKLRIPIIFYSGSCDEDTRKRALQVPNSTFLNKPASDSMLRQTINEMLCIAS
jgi:CheY-like chemotaxis protein